MRTVVAVVLCAFAAGGAQAGDLRQSLSGRLLPVQAVTVEPPAPDKAARAPVTQAPLHDPVATPAQPPQAAPTSPQPPQAAIPSPQPPQTAVETPPSPTAEGTAPAQPHAAPTPPAVAQNPPSANSAPPGAPGVPPAPAPTDRGIVPPPAQANQPMMFSMPAEQLAAIGVGVIGGLVVLDSVGVPTAAAAFLGGLAGQFWYDTARAPADDYSLTQRVPSRLWHDAAIRDGESFNRRWLPAARAGQEG